jgi:DNA-binding IclR family transcriptional regulator
MALQRSARNTPSVGRQLAKALESSKAPAISRAMAVLRLLGDHAEPLSLHSIAAELGLARSTCLYVLRALLHEELVSFDPDSKKYSQDAGVLTLARQWLRRNLFTRLAQPAMDTISQAFNVTVAGMQIVGLQHIVVVAIAQSNSGIQLSMQIGSRFPALISATGRCVAAFGCHSDAEIESRFRTLRWDEPVSLEQWRLQVRRTRTRGFAVDDGNYMSGLTVIAAPVWTRGKLSHALVAVGTGSALRRTGFSKLTKTLRASARTLTDQLRGDTDAM